MEVLLFTALVAAAVAVVVGGGTRMPSGAAWPSLLLVAALVAGTAGAAVAWRTRTSARRADAATLAAALPVPTADRGYIGSDACVACHPREHASWHRSFHRTMTQSATAATVRAPFAGETLRSADDGRTYRLRRDGDALWADISGIGARRIPMVTGSHHMQAFWLAGARPNELIEFPFTYLFDDARWVSRRDVFLVGDDYEKQPSTWNRICIECHVTGGVAGYPAAARPAAIVAATTTIAAPTSAVAAPTSAAAAPTSRVAELGIACEACHGPAALHVAANADPFRRWALHGAAAGDATIVNPARLPPVRSAEVCGQCHGIGCPPDGWLEHGLAFRPGGTLADTKPILRFATLSTSSCRADIAADHTFASTRYWRDGMVRVSGREYNGLIESRCAARGRLTCVSCHSMHDSDPNWQLARGREGDGACSGCHATIAANVPAHTHHAASSTGSSCYNCHMPHTTWGLLRAMRSHQITSPRVQDDVDAGRPNACNLCHLDRTLAWTAAALARWYGTPSPPLSDEQRTIAASVLALGRGDAGTRAIVAWNMGWPAARAAAHGDAWLAPHLVELLDDPYSAVRYNAIRSLRAISGFGDTQYDYVGAEDARWSAQRAARARLPAASAEHRAALLFDSDGRFQRGERERLAAERDEDDQMFLAE